jgi:hypothetical protein
MRTCSCERERVPKKKKMFDPGLIFIYVGMPPAPEYFQNTNMITHNYLVTLDRHNTLLMHDEVFRQFIYP